MSQPDRSQRHSERTFAATLAVDALIAGGIGCLVETLRVAKDARGVGVDGWLVIFGLGLAGATALSLLVQLAVNAALRAPSIAGLVKDFASDPKRRIVITWRALLVACAVVAFGLAVFVITSRLHVRFRFNESNVMGALVASLIAPLALATAAAAILVDKWLAPAIARFPQILAGRRSWVVVPIACTAGVLAPTMLAGIIVPEANVEPVMIGSAIIMAAITTRLVGAGRSRKLRIAALVLAVIAAAGFLFIGRTERGRAAIVTYGAVSKAIAKVMWRLADRDNDGYAPAWIGGADCDDAAPQRSPSQREIPNNGIDENCTGEDLVHQQESAAADQVTQPGTPMPHVILISLDTVRADHLGAWGYKRPISPSIDKLAAQGTRFEVALTSAPSTRYALPSLLSGRFASTLDKSKPAPTLAEVLKTAGYETAAVLCCQSILARRELRGFEEIDSGSEAVRLARKGQSNADAVAATAIDRLQRQAHRAGAPPLFLWVHFYDPHHPYHAPENTSAFGSSDLDRYDAEIAYMDRSIGQLLHAIDELNLADSSVVVLTSDHGEEFAEHGIRFHARSLYNQAIRVPLIIRVPGAPPRVISQPVSIVDVMPTILDLVGVASPKVNGRSLASVVHGHAPAPTRPVIVELIAESWYKRNAVGIVDAEWKVIWDREANAWSLYATSDVHDREDRADSVPDHLARMKRLLGETLDRELALDGPALQPR